MGDDGQMSLTDEYYKYRKKRKNEEEENQQNNGLLYSSHPALSGLAPVGNYVNITRGEEDIAPVATEREDEEEKRTWFQKGAFEDGYQFGDLSKTITDTGNDLRAGLLSGILGIGEAVVDTGAFLAGGVGSLFGADEFADKTKDFIAKDLYDERAIAEKIVKYTSVPDLSSIGDIAKGEYDPTDDSVLGARSDSLAESGGQLLAAVGLQEIGIPWWLTTGVTSFGGGVEEAFAEDATYLEAGGSAAISAGAEILTEKLFGGSGLGEKGMIDTSALTKGISNKLVKVLADFGMNMATEGAEEVASSFASNLGSALYKEENLGDILFNEQAVDEYIESFVGGAVLGGGMNIGKVSSSIANKTDYNTGLTENETKVFEKELEDRIQEAEEGGEKLTSKEKSAIYDAVMNDLQKGYISTEKIESILGGETYKTYQDTIANEDALKQEFDTLNKMKQGEMTGEQIDRRAELKQQLEEIKNNATREQLQKQLSDETLKLLQGDRKGKGSLLFESYNERARAEQKYEARDAKYKSEAAKATARHAVEDGVLNNTNRAHELTDIAINISEGTGLVIGFTNDAKLKAEGRLIDGKTPEGYTTEDGFVINVNSKKYLNALVGHELTHKLEKVNSYDEFEGIIEKYAQDRGDYEGRYNARYETYKSAYGVDETYEDKVKKEVVADLVGDYLFHDPDFVSHLSTKHRNIFQKIYDEIKYLWKSATAGSKEARELEKVKRAFEKAYRESGKQTEAKIADGEFYDSKTKYSLRVSDQDTIDFLEKQEKITTYKTMQVVDGKLYPPMAARTEGKFEDYSELGVWEQATEHPELIKNGNKYKLDKGKGQGSIEAAYNPYMHSSNLVLNDQFSGAYKRDNLVTVECEVPVSESTSGYHAEHAKDSVGWHPWHTGTVAGQLRQAKGTERQVFLSRWIKPVRIVPDSEVAAMYKDLLDGTDIAVPDNVVTPSLLNELKNAGVKIKESGRTSADTKYSLSDSDGKQLTKEQSEYFKDSKMRDENGNLKVMYHGSQDAGFHVFDPAHSDDEISLFFVDRNDVAASYSGTTETYEAKTIRTADDMNKFIESIGAEGYEVVEKDGKFTLLYEGDRVADSKTAAGIYEEFCWYEGVGEGDANYKVYLNLTNPLEVDAKGRPWNKIDAEFSQEVYDRYKGLTAEEKAALTDLAEWEDFRLFNSEIQEAAGNELASAYAKMGEDVNIYDLFSVAADNFSEESMRENARYYLKTRDFAQRAKEQGYDGVIFKNIVDVGGYSNGSEGASTVAIAFDSNQIKSVTNEKPGKNADIRYSLSEDTSGRKLTEEQVAFFSGSKIVDGKGNLKVMYHGTPNTGFTVFDKKKARTMGTYGNGFYFTDSTSHAGTYGSTYEVYLNITNPLQRGAKDITKAQLRKFVEAVAENEDYGIENYGYDASVDSVTESVYGKDDLSMLMDINISCIGNMVEAIELFNEVNGTDYNGIVVPSETVAFYPNQIKRVDNVKPTSDPDIRYSLTEYTAEEKKAHNKAVLDHFGRTYKWAETGYLLLDGTKLDLSGKHEGAPGGYRTVDHRDITAALGDDYGGGDYSGSLIQFMSEGNIRISPESNGINLSVKPTKAQEQALSDFISKNRGEVMLDIDDMDGYTVVSVEYPRGTYYTKVLNDIREWFDNGKKPEASEFSSFLSLSELGEKIKYYGNLRISGKDVAYAPVAEDVQNVPVTENVEAPIPETEAVQDVLPEDFAPVTEEPIPVGLHQAELDRLQAEMDALVEEATKAYEAEDAETVTRLLQEMETLNQEWQELRRMEDDAEAVNAERLGTLDEAPPEAEAPYYARESLTLDEKSLATLADKASELLFVEEADKAALAETIQSFAEDASLTKDDLFRTIQKDFGEIWMSDVEENTDYKEMRRLVKATRIYINDSHKGGFHSTRLDRNGHDGWDAFRKQHFGKFTLVNKNSAAGKHAMGVDSLYRELVELYPQYFPSDLNSEADQLQRIADVLDRPAREGIEGMMPLDEETLQEGVDAIYNGIMEYSNTERLRASQNAQREINSRFYDFAPVREDVAPTYDSTAKGTLEGQQTMFEERKTAKGKPNPNTAEVLDAEPEAVKRKNRAWAKFKTNFLDKGSVFEDLSLKEHNRELMGKWNYTLSSEARAQHLMGQGTNGVKSLNAIRDEVESTGKAKQFYEYVYHKHNIDRMSLAERYEDVENKPVFGDTVTADISREAVRKYEAENPVFKEYAEDVYTYMNHLRKQLVDNGVISQETANLWAEMYPHYVPIRRAGDAGLNIAVPLDTRRTGVNAPVKKAIGGSRDILPLFDTMAQRTEQTYKAIARNSFGVELKNTLGTTIETETTNLDETIDSIDAQDGLLKKGENGRNPTFTVFENGEKVTFEITEDMYDALKPTSDGLLYTNKVANTITKAHRGLLTEYNPTFMLTNAIKDVQDVFLNSQHAARTYANLPKAFAELATKGHWYNEYMENGGEQNTYFDGKTNAFTQEKKGIAKWLGAISVANNFIERAPRLAEYIASREAGASVEVAMLDAARVTTNFAAGGDITKFLNRNGATFLNASVQGAMQQVRNVREAKANGLKGVMGLVAKTAAVGLSSILLNHLLWDDDEDYEELSDYVKQNYYVVAKYGDGQFVRIPKGRALAVIQEAFVQMENLVTGNDDVDLNSFLDLVINNLAPNNPVEDNILAPIIQVANNETWYGDDLVPTRLQDLPAAEQHDESTDSISKWLGEKLDFSPYKINYLLNQYSGGLGDLVLPMLTPEAESGDNSLVGNLLAPLKSKFTTDSAMNNQNVSDFYDTKDALAKSANSVTATDEDKLMYKYINSVNTELGELYKQKREIQNSDLSDAEKYAAVRDIQSQINALAKESLASYKDVYIDGEYAMVGDRHYRLTDSGTWQKISDDQLEQQEDVVNGLGIDPSEYWSNKTEYDFAYEYPEKYAVARSVGGFEKYKTYTSELYDISADKDENGKSIRGSRKEKVIDYINNLDADYGEKIILFKHEYNADDTYNYEIIEYLNGREDISYKDMASILRELGFTVHDDGRITWD